MFPRIPVRTPPTAPWGGGESGEDGVEAGLIFSLPLSSSPQSSASSNQSVENGAEVTEVPFPSFPTSLIWDLGHSLFINQQLYLII